MINGLEHVALSVADLDRSIAFYRDVIGLEVIRIIKCGQEMPLGEVTNMPGCIASIAHLQSGPNMLELFEYKQPHGRKISHDRKQADYGLIHLGFTSTDVRNDYKRFKELGIKTFSDPIEFRTGVWLFYFYGPDGEVCELRQT